MAIEISERVRTLAHQAQAELTGQFGQIDAVAEENVQKVLSAFQKHRVADAYFAGTTGYGYDDIGRDKLDEIYADIFGTEDALVRIGFVNGTHAITCALFGALKPGDVLLSAVGAPYDTLLGAIGVADKGPGSLKDYGVTGVGLGSDVVTEAFQTYPTMFDGSYPIHSHNNYLQVWCEMGIGGLISFLALLLYQIKSGLRAFYEGFGSKKIKNVLAAALGAFGGILVVSIAEYTWFYPRNMFLFWMLFGIIATCVKLGKTSSQTIG